LGCESGTPARRRAAAGATVGAGAACSTAAGHTAAGQTNCEQKQQRALQCPPRSRCHAQKKGPCAEVASASSSSVSSSAGGGDGRGAASAAACGAFAAGLLNSRDWATQATDALSDLPDAGRYKSLALHAGGPSARGLTQRQSSQPKSLSKRSASMWALACTGPAFIGPSPETRARPTVQRCGWQRRSSAAVAAAPATSGTVAAAAARAAPKARLGAVAAAAATPAVCAPLCAVSCWGNLQASPVPWGQLSLRCARSWWPRATAAFMPQSSQEQWGKVMAPALAAAAAAAAVRRGAEAAAAASRVRRRCQPPSTACAQCAAAPRARSSSSSCHGTAWRRGCGRRTARCGRSRPWCGWSWRSTRWGCQRGMYCGSAGGWAGPMARECPRPFSTSSSQGDHENLAPRRQQTNPCQSPMQHCARLQTNNRRNACLLAIGMCTAALFYRPFPAARTPRRRPFRVSSGSWAGSSRPWTPPRRLRPLCAPPTRRSPPRRGARRQTSPVPWPKRGGRRSRCDIGHARALPVPPPGLCLPSTWHLIMV
jgi:hypothetical protein